MNSLPGTLGRPDLLGLVVAAANGDIGKSQELPSVTPAQDTSGQEGVSSGSVWWGDEPAREDARPTDCGKVIHSPGVSASAPSQDAEQTPAASAALGPTGAELEALTKAVCRGDEAAFTRFYHLYNLRLYRHLLVLAKGNEGEAREVLQTVVLKVANRFEIFDDERRLWGWLCRLARNAYVDLCRVRRREQRFVPLEEYKSELTDRPDAEHRLSESLRYALDQLAGEDRELMRAAYVDNRPLQELAEASGQTYKAIESRLARLRQKLKAKLLNHLRHEEQS
jgi:RNA polymerase sigma-70 factor (ECF subfamily)